MGCKNPQPTPERLKNKPPVPPPPPPKKLHCISGVRYIENRCVFPLTQELVEDMQGKCSVCGKAAVGGEQWKTFIWLWCDEHRPTEAR